MVEEVEGREVRTPIELHDVIAERRPGDIVTLRLLRNGARGDVDLRLAERPATMPDG